jgi:hypothetical protein
MKIRLTNESGLSSQPVLYDRFLTLLWLAEVNGWRPEKRVTHEANRPLEDAFKRYCAGASVSERDADQMVYALKMIRKTAPATITSGFQTTLNILIDICDGGEFEILTEEAFQKRGIPQSFLAELN